MATSSFFNHTSNAPEQRLLNSLVKEVVRLFGIDMYYIPKKAFVNNAVFNESSQSTYGTPYLMEFYVKNVDGFEGEETFMSKFGLQIKERITLVLSRETFSEEITPETGYTRPREGDMIYFPLNETAFEIKFVKKEPFFFQMGDLQSHEIECEIFEYSGEVFDTGLVELDNKYNNIGTTFVDSSNNTINTLDTNEKNDEIETAADGILDFSELHAFDEV